MGDRLHVLVVGHAGLAVGPDLQDRLHDGAHGEDGGRLGDAGIEKKRTFLVFIHSVHWNKYCSLGLYAHQRSL